VTDLGQSFVVDIDPTMELENVMALLEAEVSSRRLLHNQHVFYAPIHSLVSLSMNKAYLMTGMI